MTEPVMVVDAAWIDEDMCDLIKELIERGVEVHILPSEKFQELVEVPRD